MREFYDAVASRRSIRAYLPEAIDFEAVGRILECARQAPSWGNKQCSRIILVTDRALISQHGAVLNGNPQGMDFQPVPAFIVVCADQNDSAVKDGKPYYLVDAAITMEHIVLAATAEGMGTCWIGFFDEQPVRNLLGIPSDYRVVALTPLGYPAEQPAPRSRLPMEQVVFLDRWGVPVVGDNS